MKTLSVILPCYNEAENIDTLADTLFTQLDALTDYRYEVVFVDDGSTDGTWPLLNKFYSETTSVQLIRHPKNRGLGAAMRSGFQAATGDVLLTTDSDASYPFSEIPYLLNCLSPDVSMVTASPYHPQGAVQQVSPHRLALSRGCSLAYRVLLNSSIYTFTSLFRAYRRPLIDQLPFESDDFLACAELLIRALMNGHRVIEYPCELRTRVHGVSKIRMAQTIASHIRMQSRILFQPSTLRSATRSSV